MGSLSHCWRQGEWTQACPAMLRQYVLRTWANVHYLRTRTCRSEANLRHSGERHHGEELRHTSPPVFSAITSKPWPVFLSHYLLTCLSHSNTTLVQEKTAPRRPNQSVPQLTVQLVGSELSARVKLHVTNQRAGKGCNVFEKGKFESHGFISINTLMLL